jgi:ABC-type transport system substrate-binding protein
MSHSKTRLAVSTLAVAAVLGAAVPASAETFRWATTSDPNTMDPHAASSAPVLGFLNNVYEGLVRRDRTMAVEPALAVRWEALGDEGWRFHLREGVTFHNGADFTADDVLFSYERASGETSDVRSWFATVTEVNVVDDFTIDFMTSAPNPIFPGSIANFMIMDRDWAVENAAETPATDEERYTTLNTNGTAAFQMVERSPGVRTVLEPFDGWWGEVEHTITEAIYTPIQSDATMLAALIAGDVDFINPVPIQNVERLQNTDGMNVMVGKEARVMMLGFPHEAETLTYDGSPNPFADERVRRAVYHAINVDAINTTIMRGAVEPVAQLVTPDMRGFSDANAERLDYNPDGARALLAEARTIAISMMRLSARPWLACWRRLASRSISTPCRLPITGRNCALTISTCICSAGRRARSITSTRSASWFPRPMKSVAWVPGTLVASPMHASMSYCPPSSPRSMKAFARACSMRSRRSIRMRWPMCRSILSRSFGAYAMASTSHRARTISSFCGGSPSTNET